MNLTILDLLTVVASNGLILYLLSKWIEARLKSSIQHEYDKKLEDYRNSIRVREQAARVVDLLVHALHEDAPNPKEFNRLAWELSLWLPAELVWDLTRLLCRDPEAKNPKEILIEIRRSLLQDPNDKLEAAQIVHQQVR